MCPWGTMVSCSFLTVSWLSNGLLGPYASAPGLEQCGPIYSGFTLWSLESTQTISTFGCLSHVELTNIPLTPCL